MQSTIRRVSSRSSGAVPSKMSEDCLDPNRMQYEWSVNAARGRLSGELGKGSMMLDIIIQGMCCCRERVQAFSSRWVQPRCAFRLC